MFGNSFWRGRNVLITGHTGFKGSWLAYWLARSGAHVSGIALPPPTSPNLFDALSLADLVEHHCADIRDLDGIQPIIKQSRPHVVFHLAAQPLVRRSYAAPLETWQVNVMGTVHVLEALRAQGCPCVVIIITTDKVYKNCEWLHAYRETDPLGGYDPYSASKAAAELAVASWRQSFAGDPGGLALASVRAGNIIGGGDWAEDRLVPDCVRAIVSGNSLVLRNPVARRPWQHVLEPLYGYMRLAECIIGAKAAGDGARLSMLNGEFNFGPNVQSNRTVAELADEVAKSWQMNVERCVVPSSLHEASELNLSTEKAYRLMGWEPRLNFEETVARTMKWYRAFYEEGGRNARALCDSDIDAYVR
ncbi:MAG: CDP-glucose 4,6-dehydratase [Bacteroidales bacterium]